MRCVLEMADGRHETVEADTLRDLLVGCMRKAEGIASEENPLIFQVHPFEVVMAEAEMSEDRLSARLKRIATIDTDKEAMMDYLVRQYIVNGVEKDREKEGGQ